MSEYLGGCTCGRVRYKILDEPFFTHACHCSLCQKYTASAIVIHSPIETTNFVLESGILADTPGPSGSGEGHTVKRCEHCSDQIFSHTHGNERIVVLKTSTLDDPNRFPPQAHIYTNNKLKWLELSGPIPQFPKYYDREKIYPPEGLKRRKKVS